MRNDDDWILDAAYRDTTFVRNLVSMAIWNDMRGSAYIDEQNNEIGQPALTGMLVEVILNNQYQGIHTLQETLDRKLLDISKGSESSIFKAVSNFATLAFLNSIRVDFEQKYPDLSDSDNYDSLESLVLLTSDSTNEQFVENIGDLIDMDSAVDYWLFSLVTMATDNLKKNYFLYRNNAELFYFSPWDFDATFGMHWFGGVYPNNEYWPDENAEGGECLPVERPNCNLLFTRLNSVSTEFQTKLRSRWNELKNTLFTQESLSDRFQVYLTQLVPIEDSDRNAFIRNRDRWPDSGFNGRDNPELGQINWISDWISDRLNFIEGRLNAAQLP